MMTMMIMMMMTEATHETHYQAAKKTENDPDGGPWPAYPSGKSWDEASGKTGAGKKFYHNTIPGDDKGDDDDDNYNDDTDDDAGDDDADYYKFKEMVRS